jgi:hypothetical protein
MIHQTFRNVKENVINFVSLVLIFGGHVSTVYINKFFFSFHWPRYS